MILLITGGQTFCESITTAGIERDRETYMAERVALGFALDMIGPASIVAPGDHGATRWARIWAERRGVDVTAGMADECVRFPGGSVVDLPTYEVVVKL